MAKSNHTIRIISGTHRNRRLPVLDIEGLRPTGDRVRETLFNWLQMNIVGKNVLDLCAGSGALGFEAASRGAKQVAMLEVNSQVVTQLRNIKADFNFSQVSIYSQTAQYYLTHCLAQFDVVFIDPPFALNVLQELVDLAHLKVNVNGFIYCEAAIDDELIKLPKNWQLFRQKSFGQVKITLWKKNSNKEVIINA